MPPQTEPRQKSRVPPAVWIFIAAFAVRLLVLIRFADSAHFLPTSGDMKFYNDWALRILNGQWTDHKAFYGLPGYAYFLAAIYFVAGYSPFAVGLLQAAAEAATSALLFLIAGEIFRTSPNDASENKLSRLRPQIVGALAAFGWVLFQPAQTFSVILMPTSWLVLVFWACVWWLLKIRRVSVVHPWLWLGLAAGVMANMVATIFFLLPLFLAAIVLRLGAGEAWRKRIPKIAAACLLLFAGVFAGTSPCWIHNYFIAGEPVLLSAHSGVNFYIGNNATANGYPKIPPGLRAGQEGMLKDSITMAEAAAGHPLKRAEVSRFWSQKADAYIHGHFADWLRLMGVKIKNVWNAYQYDDLSLVTLFEQDGIITPGLKFGFVAALAIPGLLVAGWKYRRSRWVIAAVFLHMAALLPVFVTERYRLAAVPGLLLMASIGLWELWIFLLQKKWRAVFFFVACTAAAVWFVSQPPRDDGLWSLDFYNTGIKATDTGNLERAQKNLEIAYAYVPDNSEINFALGNLWLQKGDTTKAKNFYRRAIEINPRHSSAYNNLGVLAMDESRWKLAAAFLKKSIGIEPDDAKTHYLLAKALLQLDDTPGATDEINRALELKPDQPEFQNLRQEIQSRTEKNKDPKLP
jgi:tetratricopeptide (TPR) repeat protein